jgi:hypothetical protein
VGTGSLVLGQVIVVVASVDAVCGGGVNGAAIEAQFAAAAGSSDDGRLDPGAIGVAGAAEES